MSMLHMVCLMWKFSRDGRRGNIFTKQHKMAHKMQMFLLINQKRTFLRVLDSDFTIIIIILHWEHSSKGMQKIKPNSKCGIKESWIELNGHNRDCNHYTTRGGEYLLITVCMHNWTKIAPMYNYLKLLIKHIVFIPLGEDFLLIVRYV